MVKLTSSKLRKLKKELDKAKKEGSMDRDIITKSPNYITGKVETTKVRAGEKIGRDIRNTERSIKARKSFERGFDKVISGTEKFVLGALKLSKPKVKVAISSEKTLKGYADAYNKYKKGDKSQINLMRATW